MNRKLQQFLPLIIFIILMIGVLIGMQLDRATHQKEGLFARNQPHDRLEEVLNYINYNYVDTINTDAIMRGLVSEYLENQHTIDEVFSKLDPHSNFIPAKDLRSVNEDLEGNFDGIGVEFNIVRDTIMVISPIAGGPSAALGIRSGDKIILIEDSLVAGVGIDNQDVVRLLRGPKGTKVKVGIFRQGEQDLLDFDIERDKIPVYSVDVAYMVDQEVGYIKVNRFSRTTDREFHDALDTLKNAGMKKLILDLRGNPGGYLIDATRMSDELLSGRKMIVYTEGKATGKYEYRAGQPGLFEQGKMTVLIDEGSASASEIVAGAMQDHGRATIVGRRSFGKGLVQEIFPLQDSSALRLTIARYYTPNGRCIQRSYSNGIEAYYDDYMDRLAHGGEVPDSVRQRASLSYGIVPDLIVPVDTSQQMQFFNRLFNRGYIQRFSYDLYAKSPGRFDAYGDVQSFEDEFDVDDALYNQFLKWVTAQQPELIEQASEELEISRPYIETAIKAYIARQTWHNAGFYPIFHQLDPEFEAAYDLLNESNRPVVGD